MGKHGFWIRRKRRVAREEGTPKELRGMCNVPNFGFHCFAVGDDFMGLCQLDQRGDLMLSASSGGLEE